MKKIYMLFAIAIGLSNQVFAQYTSTISTDHVWTGRIFGWVVHDYITKIEGDSIIGGVTYKKVYNRPHETQDYYLQALMREDVNEGKVYRWSEGNELLLYDYSLAAGETATVNSMGMDYEITIESVESITVNGTPRKKLHFSDGGVPAFWIEGIGSCYGLTDPAIGFIMDYSPYLHCFYGQNALLWSSQANAFVCELELSVSDKNESPSLFEAWPNPFMDNVYVNLLGNFHNATVTVMSLTGAVVRQEKINTGVKQLNLADMQSGIYMLTITDANGRKNAKRIVKL